jgi:hypothetical protein
LVVIVFSIYQPDAGWSSLVARRAHNPKVVGSNPAPATNIIGYIAYQWFESEKADIKGYSLQRYQKDGNTAGEFVLESFNYHE